MEKRRQVTEAELDERARSLIPRLNVLSDLALELPPLEEPKEEPEVTEEPKAENDLVYEDLREAWEARRRETRGF